MLGMKTIAILVATFAISLRPLLKTLIWLHTAPPDKQVGLIHILSNDELTTRVKGKHVLLIGGTRGVGYGTAVTLAKAGARITIVGRSEKSGATAVANIQKQVTETGSISVVEFLQGDIGTICSTNRLIHKLESRPVRYEFAMVTAAIFPDWNEPLLNEDGIDKSFAIGVVGRFLIYRNLHRFMASGGGDTSGGELRFPRILNVMASGHKAPPMPFDRDVASGKASPKKLIQAMITFGLGNEIMMDSLFKFDEHFTKEDYTMVSTHPGLLKTDLHRGQGLLFDIFEGVMVMLMGTTEEEAGVLQSSILVSDKLHENALTLVDNFGYGRIRDDGMKKLIFENSDWLWNLLTGLEGKMSRCSF